VSTDYVPSREDRFSFGIWTVGWQGVDVFGSAVRPPMPAERAVYKPKVMRNRTARARLPDAGMTFGTLELVEGRERLECRRTGKGCLARLSGVGVEDEIAVHTAEPVRLGVGRERVAEVFGTDLADPLVVLVLVVDECGQQVGRDDGQLGGALTLPTAMSPMRAWTRWRLCRGTR
jgi:hypothetical protein